MKKSSEIPESTHPKKSIVRRLYDGVFGIVRRLYDWTLSWADTRYGTPALGTLSFCESSFFPVPPDVLQIALSAGKPLRSFWYATVSLVGSVLGALFGYLIGYVFWEWVPGVQNFFFTYVFSEAIFGHVRELYIDHNFLVVFTAAFTPIPYKVCTIAAGVCGISLLTLIVASIVGRGARFYAVAAVMYFLGPTAKMWIDRYFNLLTILFTIVVIIGLAAMKFFVG